MLELARYTRVLHLIIQLQRSEGDKHNFSLMFVVILEVLDGEAVLVDDHSAHTEHLRRSLRR